MDLPFHLKALPPEALDVLRYYSRLDQPVASADEISDGVGLSERTFGKVIRRLVTKGYLQMDGYQAYRLTDNGNQAAQILATFDQEEPAAPRAGVRGGITTGSVVSRRLVVVAPKLMAAGKPARVYVGFHPASSSSALPGTADMVLRLSTQNATPSRAMEQSLSLRNDAAHQTFMITPGPYKRIRLRLQVFQIGTDPDDIQAAGGMYLDVPVSAKSGPLTAHGVDVKVIGPE